MSEIGCHRPECQSVPCISHYCTKSQQSGNRNYLNNTPPIGLVFMNKQKEDDQYKYYGNFCSNQDQKHGNSFITNKTSQLCVIIAVNLSDFVSFLVNIKQPSVQRKI